MMITRSGLPRSGKSQGKTKIFQGQGKVREFCKKSGKISVLVKVSEKSGKSQGIFWVLMSGNPEGDRGKKSKSNSKQGLEKASFFLSL